MIVLVCWNTKSVLKSCASPGYYSGGKGCLNGSVNPDFFGVNIVFFIFSFPQTVEIFTCKDLFIRTKGGSVKLVLTCAYYLLVWKP